MKNILFKYYRTTDIIKLLEENRRLKIKVRVLIGAIEWALGKRGVTSRSLKIHHPRWWVKELEYRAALWKREEMNVKEKMP